MQNNYDVIARYYDVLSRMVFFNAQRKAQIDQLRYIPANSQILIVGGGTGWILEEISKIQPAHLQITYVDLSVNMLERAKKRNIGKNEVTFVHSAIEELQSEKKYTVILTAFLFDNFLEARIAKVFHQLHHLLEPGGLWIFTDFDATAKERKIWKGYLLKTMYLFFRHIAQVEASSLLQTEQYFIEAGYTVISEALYYRRFIKSTVYCCPENYSVPARAPE